MAPRAFTHPPAQPATLLPSPKQEVSSTAADQPQLPKPIPPPPEQSEPSATVGAEPQQAIAEPAAIEKATEEPAGGVQDAEETQSRSSAEEASAAAAALEGNTDEVSSSAADEASSSAADEAGSSAADAADAADEASSSAADEASSSSEAKVATAATAETGEAGDGSSFKDCAACPEMVAIPAGRLMTAELQAAGAASAGDALSRHPVAIAPFALGRFEITFDDWQACAADGGCSTSPSDEGWGRGRRPVIKVTWHDIKGQYLPWLSRKAGSVYRLPTEAEWEYAARGGPSAPAGQKFSINSDESRVCEYGNMADLSAKGAESGWIEAPCKDGFAETAPVGSLKPNSLNLYDMHGNVWEWVEDCWNGDDPDAPPGGTAPTEGDCSLRVVRGGSWSTDVGRMRSSDRGWNRPNAGSSSIGFRVAKSLE
jgi:formylglycine-generating enzyme required for sulfatase activity